MWCLRCLLYDGYDVTHMDFLKDAASRLWDIKDPRGGEDYLPLHETLFSSNAYKYTFDYKTNPARFETQAAADLYIQQLKEKTRVSFYDDSTWYKKHHNNLKRFVKWCDDNNVEYYLSKDGIYSYLQFCAESKKADVEAATTIFNHVKSTIAVVERVADWQGQVEFSKDLGKVQPISTLYKQLVKDSIETKCDSKDPGANCRA